MKTTGPSGPVHIELQQQAPAAIGMRDFSNKKDRCTVVFDVLLGNVSVTCLPPFRHARSNLAGLITETSQNTPFLPSSNQTRKHLSFWDSAGTLSFVCACVDVAGNRGGFFATVNSRGARLPSNHQLFVDVSSIDCWSSCFLPISLVTPGIE